MSLDKLVSSGIAGEEVYLSKDEYDRIMRLHNVYPIPAIKMGIIKLICTDDIEVKDEDMNFPEDADLYKSPGTSRKRNIQTPGLALWDVGSVVELMPDVTKITLSISELRDKIKSVSDKKE